MGILHDLSYDRQLQEWSYPGADDFKRYRQTQA